MWVKWPKGTLDWQAVVDSVMKFQSFLKGVKFHDDRVLNRNIYPFRWLLALNLTVILLSITVSHSMVGSLFSCTIILVRGGRFDVTRQGRAPLYDSSFNQTRPLFNYF